MSEDNTVGIGATTVAEGMQETNGVVQDVSKHAERRAAAEKAMREAMKADAAPAEVENDNGEAPPVAVEAPANDAPAEEEKKAAPVDDKAARAERVKAFLAAKAEKGEAQQLKARIAELEAAQKAAEERIRMEERRAVLEQVQKAPREFFGKEAGLSPEQLLQAAMDEATQDPVKILEKRYAALEARLQAEAQERQRLQQSLQEREQQAVIQQRQQEAVRTAMDAERFPALVARYDGDHHSLLSAMSQIASEYYERAGSWPAFDEVAEYLDSREAEVFARYTQKGASVARSEPETSKRPAKIGTSVPTAATSGSAGASEPKAISPEERKRRARAAEMMILRNQERGRAAG